MGVCLFIFSQQHNYEIVQKIGRGKYSLVFEGVDVRNKQKVAIKVLKPIKKEKIKREYYMLTTINHSNIVKILDTVKDPYTKTASFVMELVPTLDFKKINRSAMEIRHISLFLVPEGKWFLKCHKRVHFQELNYKRTLENISGDPFVKGKPQERGDSGNS